MMLAKRQRTLSREQAFPAPDLEHLQGRWRTDCLGRLTVSKHTVQFDDSTIGMCILRFREGGFVLLGKWSAPHVLCSSELSWSCAGCNIITWTKELTLFSLDPQMLGHVLRFAGRTASTNLAMACSCAFGAGLMPRPTIVAEVFDADPSAAYFDDAWVFSARIVEAGLMALTCSEPVLRRAYVFDRFQFWESATNRRKKRLGPLHCRRCRAVGCHLISEGLHSWAFRVHGMSHVRFGVVRIDAADDATVLFLPYVKYRTDSENYLSLVLDMDELDLRLFRLFCDCPKPLLLHSIANLPPGSLKLVVEFIPSVWGGAQVFWQGSVQLLGKDHPPIRAGCR